ncbi:MAG: type II toxin-antitoxin system RelE/ParE family toxin [Proteobacteria bacterium]|nr:type II toxin-antitoxin system RelE/ParE family toxin [Pseudomonadota bacterium]
MSIYQTRWFDRWARKEGLAADCICVAVREMASGLVDADLGGGLVKKRIARFGQGKRGGFRTLVATNRSSRWIFVFGFPKNQRGNINDNELLALKKLSDHFLSLSQAEIVQVLNAGELLEVNCDEQS